MSLHIFLHVWSSRSDTLEICNPGNEPAGFASDYRYINSCADPENFVRGVQLCNTDNIFFRGERIKVPLKAGQNWPASELDSFEDFENFRGTGPVLLRSHILL